MTTTANQTGLEILTASFAKGDTGSAVQLLKRGVDSLEIRLAALKHQNGDPLRRAHEEWQAAPTYQFHKYNHDWIIYPDGRKIKQGTLEWPAAYAEYKMAEEKWMRSLTKATDEKTANFVLNGHYVHATTRRLIVQLALLGYRPRLVSTGNGKYIRLSETYGEYRYQDVIEVDASVSLNGSEPHQPAEVTVLFGSSGSKNTWKVRPDGRTIDVTCWH